MQAGGERDDEALDATIRVAYTLHPAATDARIPCASAYSCCPAVVSSTLRVVRASRVHSNSCSKALIWRLSTGWAM